MIEPDEGEHEWELEWQEWMESVESHIEVRGEETMADSIRHIQESRNESW